MTRKSYQTDLTDEQWKIIEQLIPPPKPGGRPRKTDIREVINAIFYLLRSGCAWRLLPPAAIVLIISSRNSILLSNSLNCVLTIFSIFSICFYYPIIFSTSIIFRHFWLSILDKKILTHSSELR